MRNVNSGKKGQVKIQQMAFMIVTLTIFFILVGLFALSYSYSGLKSSMIASFPAAAVFFGTYDYTKYFLKNKLHIKQDYIIHLLSSIIGEASQNLVRNPFELVKQNMQIGKYESMLEAFRKIYSKLGIYVKLINN